MTAPLDRHAADLASLFERLVGLGDAAAARGLVERMLADARAWRADGLDRLAAAVVTIGKTGRWKRGADFADLALEAERSTNPETRAAFEALRSALLGSWASQPATERALGFDHRCLTTGPSRPADPSLEALRVDAPHRERCDAVVVGSGAAGSVVASVLASAGLQVTILEAGPAPGPADAAGAPLERIRRTADAFRFTGGTPVRLLAGNGVGGSTRGWYGTIERPDSKILARWREVWGDVEEGWVERRFARFEAGMGAGPIPDHLFGENANAVGSGAVRTGRAVRPLRRAAPGCDGCGTCTAGCPTGALATAPRALLPAAMRAGAVLMVEAPVERIVVERGRAAGVVARGPAGNEIRIDAPLVVLAAGTFATPSLLAASALAARSGTLGTGVSLRPTMWVAGVFDGALRAWRGIPQTLSLEAPEGVALRATAHPPGVAATLLPGVGVGARRAILAAEQLAGIDVAVDDCDARIEGDRVTWTPSEETLTNLAAGIDAAAEILFAAGAQHVMTGIVSLPPARNRETLRAALESLEARTPLRLSSSEPSGGCPVGEDPATSVLDPSGEVHGVPGLLVADASGLPTPPGCAPMLSVLLNASRVGEAIASHVRAG